MTSDLLLPYALLQLEEAVRYLTAAIIILAVVGLLGYWVALRKARA